MQSATADGCPVTPQTSGGFIYFLPPVWSFMAGKLKYEKYRGSEEGQGGVTICIYSALRHMGSKRLTDG